MAATGFVTEIAIADRIVRWCHRDQRSEFTPRAAQRALRISRVDDMEGPPRLLEDNGYVRSVGVQRAARTGRKPSDTFLVNPAVWQPGSVNSVRRAV
jgi:transposase InsO family protein